MENNAQIDKLDDINYWLDLPDDNNRPHKSLNCSSGCGEVLKYFFTKRLVKISVLSGTYIGIDHHEFNKLCESCKISVYNWYFNDVFGDDPKIPLDAFELAIEESNAACNWDMAEREYGRMITDYNDNPDTVITNQQLDETKENCKGHEKEWKNAYCRLQAKWRQLKSKRKNDESIKSIKQEKLGNSDTTLKEGNFDP